MSRRPAPGSCGHRLEGRDRIEEQPHVGADELVGESTDTLLHFTLGEIRAVDHFEIELPQRLGDVDRVVARVLEGAVWL